jgi:pimeloyl-ACP methyl ester carboxylesterase
MSFEEFPVFVPAGEERLGAVVCAPAGEGRDLGVLLLTGGNYTRTHRNGMWTRAARALAERGFPSIRLDYHGVGDSTGTARLDLEDPFDADALFAAAFLRRAADVPNIAVVATCFGGRTGIAAAAADPSIVAATVFPVPILSRAGSLRPRTQLKRRLAGGPLGGLLRRPAVRRMRQRAVRRHRAALAISPRFRRDLITFLERGEVWFVYGDRTSSLPEFRRLLDEIEPRISADQRRRLHLEILEGMEVAGFLTLRDQDLAVEKAVSTVEAAYRSAVGGSLIGRD